VATRDWIRLDIGLLDDDRFEQLTPEQSRAWLVAYLLIARERDAVKDLDRITKLLTKQGVPDAARVVAELDAAGWFVPAHRKEGWTLRGYESAQPVMRGLSDDPASKAERNAARPTTKAGRQEAAALRGASRGARGANGATRTDITDKTSSAHTRTGETRPASLKDVLGTFEEVMAKGKEAASSSTS
jgi:hypothetical protein